MDVEAQFNGLKCPGPARVIRVQILTPLPKKGRIQHAVRIIHLEMGTASVSWSNPSRIT